MNVARGLGIGFWVVVTIVGGIAYSRVASSSVSDDSNRSLSLLTRTDTISIIDPTGSMRVGDSAFAVSDQAPPRQVGHVIAITPMPELDPTRSIPPTRLDIELYDLPGSKDDYVYEYRYASGRLDDLLVTLVPDAKREILIARISEAMREHGQAISDAMLPIAIDSFRRSLPLLETGLRRSLANHQPEITALVSRYRQEIIERRLKPLVQDEVIPILRKHGQGPAEEIGQEIWQRAPLFQLGWKAVYDQSPLPKRDMLREEFDRFVDEQVIPIVQSHMDEIVAAIEQILVDLAGNDRIRDEFSAAASQIAADPEARRLVRVILTETVIENEELRRAWQESWSTPQAKAALRDAGARIQPVLRKIADEVMGTREGGIEPGFARILRNQILGKDRTWITLQPIDPSHAKPVIAPELPSLVIRRDYQPYPIVRLASPQ